MCVGGQAVNAYVEPVVSLDLDLVVAVDQIEQTAALLGAAFRVKRFPHSLNVSLACSDLRVQIHTDRRYADFVGSAAERVVLGLQLPVAGLEDVLQGKVRAAQDEQRRASKRQKNLADIARLLESTRICERMYRRKSSPDYSSAAAETAGPNFQCAFS